MHCILVKKLLWVSLFFFFITLFLGSCQRKGTTVHHILLIHSYEETNPIYPSLNKAIKDAFKKQGVVVDIRMLYLNSEIYWPHEKNAIIRKFLNDNASWKPEVLLVNDDQALFSLVNSNNKRSHKIPIIFAGVNYMPWQSMRKFNYTNIAGFHDEPDLKKNIELIERLSGKSVIDINFDQTSDYGALVCENIYRQLKGSPYRMDFSSLYKSGLIKTAQDSLLMPQDSAFNARQLDIRTQRPDSTYVHMVNFRRGMSGESLWNLSNVRPYMVFLNTSYSFASNKICQLFSRPAFSAVQEGFGEGVGILGGYFTTAQEQAREEVDAAVRLFNGATIAEIGIHQSKKEYLLDWKAIFRWNWKPVSDIPSYVKIMNMPFYVKYEKQLLWGGTSFLLVVMVVVVYLTYVSRRERRKKEIAEQYLRLERAYLQLAMKNGNIYVWRIEEAPYLIFDKDFYEALGFPADEKQLTQGFDIMQLSERVHPDDRSKFVNDTRFVLSHRDANQTIQCRIDFGKGYQWWEFRSGVIFLNSVKKSYMIVGLCLNIQSFKDNELTLIKAREKAEEADHMKSAFVANMSHDIRTPLNAIVGFSNLLAEDEEIDADEKVLCINSINANSQYLLKLISDILDLSRIESGRIEMVLKECSMHELMQQVYDTYRILMPEDVELKMSLPEKEVKLVTDYHRVVEVMTNLISNSIKFTTQGSISIGYDLNADGTMIRVYVKDTGKGIPQDKQKMVFERFSKVDEYAKGTGLGLVICKHIVEKLGGTILLESEGEGKGSCFSFTLPTKK